MEKISFNSSCETDVFHLSEEIDHFFSVYPLPDLNKKLWQFFETKNRDEIGEDDLSFYEELVTMMGQVKKKQDCQKEYVRLEPSFNEQTLVCMEGVVNLIKQAIPVGMIYNLSDNKEVLDLIVVLEKNCTKPYSDFENIIDLALLGYQSGTCTIHNYGLLNSLIQSGHLFYQTACIKKNIIYQKSTEEVFTHADLPTLKANHTALKTSFGKGIAKAANFYDGAQYFVKGGVNDMAVFMLRQSCELTYRCLLQVLRGRDVKCHSPAVLRKHLKRFAPAMLGIFSIQEEEELSYLQVLEDAYVKSRYQQNYLIDDDLLLFLNDKIGLLLEKANQLFEEKIELINSYILDREEALEVL